MVDFHGIQNGIGFKEKPIEAAGVERVRTSYFSDKSRNATRIVFDILEQVSYQVVDDGNGVRVVFAGPVSEKPASPALPNRLLEPVISPLERAPVTLTAGPPMVVEAPAKAMPVGSLLIPTMRQTPAPQVPAALAAGQTPQQYTGEITSFDLKDIDLKDFFRLIANMSGLNIVLDSAVSGTVTLSLTDVPWDQALDIVLKNNNLGSQLQGNVLRIATNATLAARRGRPESLSRSPGTERGPRDEELSSELHEIRFRFRHADQTVVAARHDHPGSTAQRSDCFRCSEPVCKDRSAGPVPGHGVAASGNRSAFGIRH